MGRTYEPNNKQISDFDINFAGARVLALISDHVGFAVHYEGEMPEYFDIDPLWNASDAEARKAAEKLESAPRGGWIPIYQISVAKKWFAGTLDEFTGFVSEWAAFLKNCNGYSVPM